MEAGKIFRPLSAILGLRAPRDSQDRDPQQGGQGYSRQYPNRQPTKDEVEKVYKWLSAQDSMKKTGLTVTVEEKDGVSVLMIRDNTGKVLKSLFGEEIFRLLELSDDESNQRGSIIDRRI